MVEKLKKEINNRKSDKSNMKDFVKVFCENNKVNEFFKDNKDFQELKEETQKK